MAKSFKVLFPIEKHIFPIGFYIRYRGDDTLWISILRVRGRKMTQYARLRPCKPPGLRPRSDINHN